MEKEDKMALSDFFWLNPPRKFSVENDRLTIVTDPETDYWQSTYYGFRNDNGHAFVKEIEGNFSFTVKTEFEANSQYDQCGIILYQDSNNWMKASVESENQEFARLGSVVTNLGYSDWASTDISPKVTVVWYRLSRRGQDFYIESSIDGNLFQQMRMFHIHNKISVARIGVYACSPLESSFTAEFSEFEISPCVWPEYKHS